MLSPITCGVGVENAWRSLDDCSIKWWLVFVRESSQPKHHKWSILMSWHNTNKCSSFDALHTSISESSDSETSSDVHICVNKAYVIGVYGKWYICFCSNQSCCCQRALERNWSELHYLAEKMLPVMFQFSSFASSFWKKDKCTCRWQSDSLSLEFTV